MNTTVLTSSTSELIGGYLVCHRASVALAEVAYGRSSFQCRRRLKRYVGTKNDTCVASRIGSQKARHIAESSVATGPRAFMKQHGSDGHSLPANGKDVDGVALAHEADSVFQIDAIRFMIYYSDHNYGLYCQRGELWRKRYLYPK
jgi:hypothetical protein